MKIKRQALHDASSSCRTSRNLSAPSLIIRTRLNDEDLHPSISSEPLMRRQIERSRPNVACSSMERAYSKVSSNQTVFFESFAFFLF